MKLHAFLNHHGHRHYVGILAEQNGSHYFEYAKDFLSTGIALSPFKLPLEPGVKEAPREPFDGLFGLFNDSLPDGWGLLLLDRLLRERGTRGITPLARLAMVGSDGMGALEYEPAFPSPDTDCPFEPIQLDGVAGEARQILNEEPLPAKSIGRLLCLNGSSGGARPKILVKVSQDRSCLLPDSAQNEGFEPWLVKFPSHSDRENIGMVEYAFSLAAKQSGIAMTDTHLFEGEEGGKYFGVKRFDRDGDKKIHVHTASGLLHASHRFASLDYETLLRLTQILCRNVKDVEMMVRLMIFNVKSGNRDDHAKNFSFMMDENYGWSLAPAYDLTPSVGIGGEHMSMVNNKGKDIQDEDLMAAALTVDVARDKVKAMIDQVEAALGEYTAEIQGL